MKKKEKDSKDALSLLPSSLSAQTSTTVQTLPLQEDTKTILNPPLPALNPKLLKTHKFKSVVYEAKNKNTKKLYRGTYEKKPVTLLCISLSSERLIDYQNSLNKLLQSASPFWLPIIGVCHKNNLVGQEDVWVMPALPSTPLETYLTSSAADAWVNRCRLVRDVAIGLYQRRATGADRIAWDIDQLYVDEAGRAQLAPLLSKKPVEEKEDLAQLGQLLWQVVRESPSSEKLPETWEEAALWRGCPPVVRELMKTYADPTAPTASLKALAKQLDALWQQAQQTRSASRASTDDERKKRESSSSDSLTLPLLTISTAPSKGLEISQSDSASPPSSESATPQSTTSTASTSDVDLVKDDKMFSWVDCPDPRYQVEVKLWALRKSIPPPSDHKTTLPALQQEVQRTLLDSKVEVLLWLGANEEDPSLPFAEVAWRLWQELEWQAYRPGDPPPTAWLPLWIDLTHSTTRVTPLFTRARLLPEEVSFNEAEWQTLRTHYSLFYLVQGSDGLPEHCNLYRENALYRLAGRARLLVHSTISVAFKREEMTDFMPHTAGGRVLMGRYARYISDPACKLNIWEGCCDLDAWQGADPDQDEKEGEMVQGELDTPRFSVVLTPSPNLTLDLSELIVSKKPLSTKGSRWVYPGTYYGQNVAVKRFSYDEEEEYTKEYKLTVKDQAELEKEAKIMAALPSDFLVRVWGYSLHPHPLVVMELLSGSLSALLEDKSHELPWDLRYRLLRDTALGLLMLHANGLLHCDLKSDNILIDTDQRAKLADFGVSNLVSKAPGDVGTPQYIAPEIYDQVVAELQTAPASSETKSTQASDVYSFGVVCWEVATRCTVVRASAWKKTKDELQTGKWSPEDYCPSPLIALIHDCCTKEADKRPKIEEVAYRLEQLWLEKEPTPTVQDGKKLSPQPTPEVVKIDSQLTLAPKSSFLSRFRRKSGNKEPTVSRSRETLSSAPVPPALRPNQSPDYTLGIKLRRLRQAVLDDPFITQELSCYIDVNGQARPGASTDPLYPWVQRELLTGSAQVLVLQGLVGAGKSTFNRDLLRKLWQDPAWQVYRPGDPLPKAPVPIWIPLGSNQVQPSNLWDYYRHLPEIDGFTGEEIDILKKECHFIWLADGYDEIPGQATPNLYDLNRLAKQEGRVKLVISCRSQRVETLSESTALAPHPMGSAPDWTLYRTRYVAPFTPQQMQDYIEKYVAIHCDDWERPKDWDAARYKREFTAIPELQTLIDTPFMLWMTLSILPNLTSERQPKITRAVLYDRFMEMWFIRQARKAWQAKDYLKNPAAILGKPAMQTIKAEASKTSSQDVQILWLTAAYRAFCLTFAQQLTLATQVSIQYDRELKEEDSTHWIPFLFGDTIVDGALLRQGCPLHRSRDHSWSFIHASLVDYFMTTGVTEQLLLPSSLTASEVSSLFIPMTEQAVTVLRKAPLNPEQVRFLTDRVKQEPRLETALFALIQRSQTEKAVATASANAATVLNACHVNFIGKDWQNVQLPGADLCYGVLAHCDLRGANLRGAMMMRTILYQTNLTGADLREVRWGEWPSLRLMGRNFISFSVSGTRVTAHHPRQPWVIVMKLGRGPQLLNIETGECIGEFIDRSSVGTLSCFAFSPDGQHGVSGNSDRLNLWDVATQTTVGKPLTWRLRQAHSADVFGFMAEKTVYSVAFSPDGRYIMSGHGDGTLRLWNVATQMAIGEPFFGHTNIVKSVAFSPVSLDGRQYVVSGSSDNTLRLWDMVGQTAVGEPLIGHTYEVNSVAFSPDSRYVVSGSGDRTLRLWAVATRTAVGKAFIGHTRSVRSVAFSPDGKWVASGGDYPDNSVRLWDAATQTAVGEPLIGHTREVDGVAFSPDGRRVISISLNAVRVWDLATQATVGKPLTGHTYKVMSVACSADGRYVVSGSLDSTLCLWDVAKQTIKGKPLIGHGKLVRSVAFSPNGDYVVSGSADTSLQLWDAATQTAIGEPLFGHGGTVWCVAFSPCGRYVASGSEDQTLCVWNLMTQAIVGKPLTGHTGWVYSVAFSPNGWYLVSGSQDKTLRLWDVAMQTTVGEPLTGHTFGVSSVAFSPNGKYIVSGGLDHSVRVWHVATQAAVGWPLRGHTDRVNSVAFSPDSQYVVSGGDDETVRLWDINTGHFLTMLRWAHSIETLSFLPKMAETPGLSTSSENESSLGRLSILTAYRDSLVRQMQDGRQHSKVEKELENTLKQISEIENVLKEQKENKSDSLVTPGSQKWAAMAEMLSSEEHTLVIGDEMGTISFWTISPKEAAIRFLGMPRHKGMPLLFGGVKLPGCRMDPQTQRLLARSGVPVNDGVVEEMAETVVRREDKPEHFPPSLTLSTDATKEKKQSAASTNPTAQVTQALLTEAYRLLDEIYPRHLTQQREVRQSYETKLVHYEKNSDTLDSTQRNALQKLVGTLRGLHKAPTTTIAPGTSMTMSDTTTTVTTTSPLPALMLPPSSSPLALTPSGSTTSLPGVLPNVKYFLQEDKLLLFKKKKVASDGNCLFHSMAYGIKQFTPEIQTAIRDKLQAKEQAGTELKTIDDRLLRRIAVKLLNEKVQDTQLAQDLVEQGLVPLVTLDEKEYEYVLKSMASEDKTGELRTKLNSIRSAVAETKDAKAYHALIADKTTEWAGFYRDILGIPEVWGGSVELYALENYLGIRFDLRQQLNLGPLPERLVKYTKLQQLLKRETEEKTSLYIGRIKMELKTALSLLLPLDDKERANQVGSQVIALLAPVLRQISKKNKAGDDTVDIEKLAAYLETPAAIQHYCAWFRIRKVLRSPLDEEIHHECLLDKYRTYGLTAEILRLIQQKDLAITDVYCSYNTSRVTEVTPDRRIQVVYTGTHYDIVEPLPSASPISLKTVVEAKTTSSQPSPLPSIPSIARGKPTAAIAPPAAFVSSRRVEPIQQGIVIDFYNTYQNLVRLSHNKEEKIFLIEKLCILEYRKYKQLGQAALEKELERLTHYQELGRGEETLVNEHEYQLVVAKSVVLSHVQRQCGRVVEHLQDTAGWYGVEISRMLTVVANQAVRKKEGLLGVQMSSISSHATLAEMMRMRDELLKINSNESGIQHSLPLLGLVANPWGIDSGPHFGFNLIIDTILVVFDPLGGNKVIQSDKACAAIHTFCQEQKITHIVVVGNQLQQDAEQTGKPQSAGGPISVAMAQQVFHLGAVKLRNWLQTILASQIEAIKTGKNNLVFRYKSADLISLFREEAEDQGLVSLVRLTADKEQKVDLHYYHIYLANLRKQHSVQRTAATQDALLQTVMESRLSITAGYIESDQTAEVEQQAQREFAQLQYCFLSGKEPVLSVEENDVAKTSPVLSLDIPPRPLRPSVQSGLPGMSYGRLLGSTPSKNLTAKKPPSMRQHFEDLNKELSDLQEQYTKEKTPELAEKLKTLSAEIAKREPAPSTTAQTIYFQPCPGEIRALQFGW